MSTSSLVTRRTVIAGLAASALAGSARARPSELIVETTLGKVRGSVAGNVCQFKGIPYAASTAGANRFRPPQSAAPWAGVRDALRFGRSAPQAPLNTPERAAFSEIEAIDEDCLSLNIYTPGTGHGSRRPIMVWLHGGGWRFGAGSAPGLRGARLAKDGDVVLITLNHRLDMFGFLRIDDRDERFADAGNAGILDIIAALRWIRANAEAFGGDPHNVTIFGQSGGAAKVAALLGTPKAAGLFHKAIAMSGSGCLRICGEEEASALSANLASRLGLPRLTGEALQHLPLEKLIAVANGPFRPVLDGRTFTRHPYDPDAPPSAAGIPLLVGNVATETRIMMAGGGLGNFALDPAEVQRRLGRFLRIDPASTRQIFDTYASFQPAASPSDLLATITSDYMYVRNTGRMADLHRTQAPVHRYMFMRRTPVDGGILGAPHEAELPFVFGTADVARNMVGTGPDIEPMTLLMIATWSAFAHTGNPGNRRLPAWPDYPGGERGCMLIGPSSRVGDIPGRNARSSLNAFPLYEYSMPSNYTHV